MIGILMSKSELKQIERRPKNNEDFLGAYSPLADKYKVNLFFYSKGGLVSSKSSIHGLMYSYRDHRLKRSNVQIPKINIYRNTAYLRGAKAIKKVKGLIEEENIQFINLPFNSQRNKLKNYNYLKTLDNIQEHLPETAALTLQNVKEFLNNHHKIIIKPKLGARGRGITIIENLDGKYHIYRTFSRKGNKGTEVITEDQLSRFYENNYKREKGYLVQEWIHFKKYNNRPFDIRVSVQKKHEKWKVSSCVARVAAQKGLITNLHQGGAMVSYRKLKLPSLKRKIYKLCIDIARAFEKKYPSTADTGIDIAIDKNHKIWYIEANFCSDKERWSTKYKIPFEYAYSKYVSERESI